MNSHEIPIGFTVSPLLSPAEKSSHGADGAHLQPLPRLPAEGRGMAWRPRALDALDARCRSGGVGTSMDLWKSAKHGQKGPRNATRSREAEKPDTSREAEKPRSTTQAEKPRSRQAEKPRSPAQAEKPRSREAEKPPDKPRSREAEKPRSRGAAGQAEKPRSREAEKPPGKPRSREAEKPPDKPRSREATGQAETVALEPPLNTMLHLHHHKTSTPQPPLNNTLHLETTAPPPPLNICCIFEDQASDPLWTLPRPVKLLHSLKIFNEGLILPAPSNFYIHWRSSMRV